MVEISSKVKRCLKIKLNGKVLELLPPKIKTLKKLMELVESIQGNTAAETVDQLMEVVLLILQKNKKDEPVSEEFVQELEYDEISSLIEHYFSWVQEIQQDPN